MSTDSILRMRVLKEVQVLEHNTREPAALEAGLILQRSIEDVNEDDGGVNDPDDEGPPPP